MKKFILVCTILAGSVLCTAQETVVKINPIGALFGSINVGVERVVSEDGSAQLNIGFISRKIGAFGFETKYSGFGVSPEYRHHIGSHENPKGPYVGGFANVNSIKATVSDDGSTSGGSEVSSETKYFGIGAGVLIGYEWILSEAFALDLTVGAGYQSVSVSNETDGVETTESDFGLAASGVLPKISFAIGYAF